jgi:hypothetical protein
MVKIITPAQLSAVVHSSREDVRNAIRTPIGFGLQRYCHGLGFLLLCSAIATLPKQMRDAYLGLALFTDTCLNKLFVATLNITLV